MNEKGALRREMRLRLSQIAPHQRAAWSRGIARRVLAMDDVAKAQRLMLFCGMDTEPDTLPLMDRLAGMGKEVYLPRVLGKGEMDMVRYLPGCPMTPGPYGILQPVGPACRLAPHLVLAPGVAFDRWGGRLGHGAGYYDRFLAHTGAPAVGLAFELQMVEKVPGEEHDVKMGLVITQRSVYRAGKEMENC